MATSINREEVGDLMADILSNIYINAKIPKWSYVIAFDKSLVRNMLADVLVLCTLFVSCIKRQMSSTWKNVLSR